MTDIPTTLNTLNGELATVQPRLAAAAQGSQAASAAADAASHDATVRSALANEVSCDPSGTVLQGRWTTAANAWLSAPADAAAAGAALP